MNESCDLTRRAVWIPKRRVASGHMTRSYIYVLANARVVKYLQDFPPVYVVNRNYDMFLMLW
jgi:hypothetical protein